MIRKQFFNFVLLYRVAISDSVLILLSCKQILVTNMNKEIDALNVYLPLKIDKLILKAFHFEIVV